jgi:hypothetical protein
VAAARRKREMRGRVAKYFMMMLYRILGVDFWVFGFLGPEGKVVDAWKCSCDGFDFIDGGRDV